MRNYAPLLLIRPATRGSLLFAALLVAACGSDDADSTPGTDAGPDTTTSGDADPTPDTSATGCPEPAGAPTEHSGFIEADETWGPGIHLVTYEVSVRPGVTLTIAPCAVVRIAADQSIAVDDEAGGLVAIGTAEQPIVFERADANSAWGSLNVYAPATIQLEHAVLRGGGTSSGDAMSAAFAGAPLVGRNQLGERHDTLLVRSVTIEDASGIGVLLDSSGFIEGSSDLTVRGADLNPVYVGAGYATNLPDGAYTGNGDDRFLLQSVGPAVYDSSEPILWDAVLPNRGLPYLVGFEGTHPSIVVGDGRPESPSATLTIEPGVELFFQGGDVTSTQLLVRGKPDGDSWVPQGTLIANGTAEAPIVLTSAEQSPAPGDWQGLYFRNVVSQATSLSHLHIKYAGGESVSTGRCVASQGAENFDADCSVILWLDVPPTEQFLRNSLIENGNACGIYRGWSGAAVDFTATNTFRNLSGCDQSNVYEEGAGCTGGSCE